MGDLVIREMASDDEWDAERERYRRVDWDARAKALLDGSAEQLYEAIVRNLLDAERARTVVLIELVEPVVRWYMENVADPEVVAKWAAKEIG